MILNQWWQDYLAGKLTNPCSFLSKLRQQRSQNEQVPEETERFLDAPVDGLRFDAPKRLSVPKAYFTSARYLRQHDRADWQQTDPQLQRFAARLIEAFKRKGIPLYVHTAFRTAATQRALHQAGHSKALWPNAPHTQGKAADIVHAAYHWEMTPSEWKLIGKVGKELAHNMGLNIVWGGDWSFYDPAHWEIANWRDNIKPTHDTGVVRKTPKAILMAYREGTNQAS